MSQQGREVTVVPCIFPMRSSEVGMIRRAEIGAQGCLSTPPRLVPLCQTDGVKEHPKGWVHG